MKMKVFSVYDSKVEAFMQPLFFTTGGQAIRVFADTVNSPNHQFAAHPEDFTLFELGSFDDATAKFENLLTPHSLGLATEFKK